jgi:hypothetical protein
MAARVSSFLPHFGQSCGLFLDLEFRAVFRFNYQTASSFLANAARAGLARYAQGKRHRPYSLSRPGQAFLLSAPSI